MNALVLCAGFGKRLGFLCESLPKPLLEVGGISIVEHILWRLSTQGFTRVFINLHYRAEEFAPRLGDGSRFGIELHYRFEPVPLGTGGTTRDLLAELGEEILVHYGDILTDHDLRGIVRQHRRSSAWATLLVHQRAGSNSIVTLDDDQRISRFVERPEMPLTQTSSALGLLRRLGALARRAGGAAPAVPAGPRAGSVPGPGPDQAPVRPAPGRSSPGDRFAGTAAGGAGRLGAGAVPSFPRGSQGGAVPTAAFIEQYLSRSQQALAQVSPEEVERVVGVLERAFDRRARVFIAGNGGSASLASHLACDLEKTASGPQPRLARQRLRAHSLNDNMAILTAWANDEGFELVFSEQLRAHAEAGDVLVVISASGNSPNIVAALETAAEMGLQTIALLGFDGGRALRAGPVRDPRPGARLRGGGGGPRRC